MDYRSVPVKKPLSQKVVYPDGANAPTVKTRYRCACGLGRLLHVCVPGFDDEYYEIKCLFCRRKYDYVSRVGYNFEYYPRKR